MSPINERRLANFKRNKRGYYSLWIFLCLFVIGLFANVVANDRPIVLLLDGELFVPVLVDYSEQDIGGELPIVADFTDPVVRARVAQASFALWPPIPYRYDTIDYGVTHTTPLAPGQDGHLLGTDNIARDLFALLLYGFRISVLFGLALTAISVVVGVSIGAVQGYFGGKIDLIGQRVMEIWSGLPVLFLLIILASIIEPTIGSLLAVLALFGWMPLVGVTRAEFLRARNFDFVRAARALGVDDFTIMRRHVLPNAMVAALTYVPFVLTGAITSLTALDFLGFGLPIDQPSMGRLLSTAKSNLQAPWIGLSVFITLAVMLTLLIFIGEAVRDAFDPRKTFATSGDTPSSSATVALPA